MPTDFDSGSGKRMRSKAEAGLWVKTALVAACVVASAPFPAAQAREQWQMQQPEGPVPTGPIGKGYGASNSGGVMVPGMTGIVPNNGALPAANFGGNNSPGASGSAVPGLVGGAAGGFGNGAGPGVPGLVNTAPYASSGKNQGYTPPPRMMHGAAAVSPEFIQQFLATQVASGTVLTGVLSDDISSKKSRSGDLFSIVLKDGYYVNGREVIPRGARIVGSVQVVAPAASKRGVGSPGHVDVGLSTLIFPDGRSLPFTGLIERNPAHDMKQQPKVKGAGFGLSDYGRSVGSMFGSFTSGIGAVRRNVNRGKDLLLEEGELIPVRVTRGLDLTKMSPPSSTYHGAGGGDENGGGGAISGAPPAVSGFNPLAPSPAPQSTPGLLPGAPPGFAGGTASPIPQTNPYLPKELPDPF